MAESATATKSSSDKAPAAPQTAVPEKEFAGGPTMYGMSPQEMQQRFGNAGAAAFVSGDGYGGRDAELRLPAGLANTFEQRFGQPVDQARIKVGPSANRRVVRYGKSAVTIGDVIYFRTGSFRPETIEDLALLAHELVHVIHQTGDRSQLTPGTGAEAEAEAEKLSLPTSESAEPVGLSVPVGPQGAWYDPRDWPGGVKGAAVGAYEWTEDQLKKGVEWMINQVAPDLIKFLRNPLKAAEELLWGAADTILSGLLNGIGVVDLVAWLEEKLAPSQASAENFDGSMGEDALDRLGGVIEFALEFMGRYGTSFLQSMQDKIEAIRGPTEEAWERIAKPVVDFLGDIGGAAWTAITDTISIVWGAFSKVIGAVGSAAGWLMDQFGISWGGDGSDGNTDAKNWFMEKLGDAWNVLKEAIKLQLKPLVAIYEALKQLWEMEEVRAIVNSMQEFWNQCKWVAENWSSDEMMIALRETLQNNVLPPALSFLNGFGELVTAGVTWLGEKVALFVEPIALLVEKVVGHEHLTKVSAIAVGVVGQLNRFSTWAKEGFPNILGAFQAGLDKLKGSLETVLDFLIELAMVIVNPLGLPGFLLGKLWMAIPDRFKPTLITFVVQLLKTFVMAFGLFGGPLSLVLSDAIVGFLDVLLESSPEAKIAASNRIAELLVGSAEFIAGFFFGLLRGVWQAFIDPFKMVYELIKALYGVATYVVEWLDSLKPDEGGSSGVMRRVDAEPDVGDKGVPRAEQRAVVDDAVAQAEAMSDSDGPFRLRESQRTANAAQAPGVPSNEAGVTEPSGVDTPVGEDAEPELTLEERLADADTDAQSALIREVYGPSKETEEGLRAGKATGETKEQEVTESEAQASGSGSASEGGLSSLLGQVWDSIVEAASNLGRSLGEKFFGFLGLGDREIGDKIGWLTGTVLFEVVITYLTGGATQALRASSKTVKAIISIIDLGGTIFNGLFKLVGKLGKTGLRAGLKGIRGVLDQIPGMGAAVDWIDNVLNTVFKHGDEVAENTAKHADEAAEQAGKQADEGASAAGRHSDEAAEKAAELPQAIALAKAIIEANEKAGTPPQVLVHILQSSLRRYRWIDRFSVVRSGSSWDVFLHASKHKVDDDYETNGQKSARGRGFDPDDLPDGSYFRQRGGKLEIVNTKGPPPPHKMVSPDGKSVIDKPAKPPRVVRNSGNHWDNSVPVSGLGGVRKLDDGTHVIPNRGGVWRPVDSMADSGGARQHNPWIGQWGEAVADNYGVGKGWKKVNGEPTTIGSTFTGPNKIDHVFETPDGRLIIADSKTLGSKQGKTKAGTLQMSENWIKGRTDDLPDHIAARIRRNDYTPMLLKIDSKGNVTEVALDRLGVATKT